MIQQCWMWWHIHVFLRHTFSAFTDQDHFFIPLAWVWSLPFLDTHSLTPVVESWLMWLLEMSSQDFLVLLLTLMFVHGNVENSSVTADCLVNWQQPLQRFATGRKCLVILGVVVKLLGPLLLWLFLFNNEIKVSFTWRPQFLRLEV